MVCLTTARFVDRLLRFLPQSLAPNPERNTIYLFKTKRFVLAVNWAPDDDILFLDHYWFTYSLNYQKGGFTSVTLSCYLHQQNGMENLCFFHCLDVNLWLRLSMLFVFHWFERESRKYRNIGFRSNHRIITNSTSGQITTPQRSWNFTTPNYSFDSLLISMHSKVIASEILRLQNCPLFQLISIHCWRIWLNVSQNRQQFRFSKKVVQSKSTSFDQITTIWFHKNRINNIRLWIIKSMVRSFIILRPSGEVRTSSLEIHLEFAYFLSKNLTKDSVPDQLSLIERTTRTGRWELRLCLIDQKMIFFHFTSH
jgi:hypothetical protein